MLIWDTHDSPPAYSGDVVLWRDYAMREMSDHVSIPELVEQNSVSLRCRYLESMRILGETRYRDRRLIDLLQIRPELSYWWMTLLAEKCNYSKLPSANLAIRLMAFEDWVEGHQLPERVVLATDNDSLAKSIRAWCKELNIPFHAHASSGRMRSCKGIFKWVKDSLPPQLRALASLVKHLCRRWPLQGVGLDEWKSTTGWVTMVGYSDNLVEKELKQGVFRSRYWGPLPELMARHSSQVNWLHLYVPDTLMPDAASAASRLREFNRSGRGGQAHVTLDSFLSVSVVARTLFDWVMIMFQCPNWKQICQAWPGARSYAFCLYAEDWRKSFSGTVAIGNLLALNLFQVAMRQVPRQRLCVYLQEFQPWEVSLINGWRKAGHGTIIGTPHSTVRFWDLRYFFDSRLFADSSINRMPLPDKIAVNGQAMAQAFRAGDYPARELIQVEALRYLHLLDVLQGPTSRVSSTQEPLVLLYVGEYLRVNTVKQVGLLVQALSLLTHKKFQIIIKPHPNCPVFAEDFPSLLAQVINTPLPELLNSVDIVYSGNVTSAAVDAYCAGLSVVCYVDPDCLDLSPLKGCSGVAFVRNANELADMLSAVDPCAKMSGQGRDFFYLDAELPRWSALLLECDSSGSEAPVH